MKYLLLLCSLFVVIFLYNCGNQQGQPASDTKAKQTVTGFDTASVKPLPPEKQQLTKLGYNYKEGDVLHYRIEERDEEATNDSIRSTSTTILYYTKAIKSVREGLCEFEMKYDSIITTVSQNAVGGRPAQSLRFNSNDSADKVNPRFIKYTSLIGENVRVTVNTLSGTIEEVEGMTAILKKIIAADTAAIPYKDRIADELKTQMYAQTLGQEGYPMPTDSDLVKRSWTKSLRQNVPPAYNVSSDIRCQLGSVSQAGKSIAAEINLTVNGTFDVLPQAKQYISLKKGSLSGTGKVLVDTERGYTMYKKIRMVTDLQGSSLSPTTKKKVDGREYKVQDITLELLQ